MSRTDRVMAAADSVRSPLEREWERLLDPWDRDKQGRPTVRRQIRSADIERIREVDNLLRSVELRRARTYVLAHRLDSFFARRPVVAVGG